MFSPFLFVSGETLCGFNRYVGLTCIMAVLLVMYKVVKSKLPCPVFLLYSFAYYLSEVTEAFDSCFSCHILALIVIEINALNFIRLYNSLTEYFDEIKILIKTCLALPMYLLNLKPTLKLYLKRS